MSVGGVPRTITLTSSSSSSQDGPTSFGSLSTIPPSLPPAETTGGVKITWVAKPLPALQSGFGNSAGTQSLNGDTSAVATATATMQATLQPSTEGPNAGAIVGSLIGVIAVLGLVAGFLLYRRKYMNKNGPTTDSEREAIEANTQFLPSTPIVRPIVRSILYLSDTDFSISESVAFQMAQRIKQHAQLWREKHVKVTDTNDVLSALTVDVDKVVFVTQKAGRIQETKTGEILRVLEQHCQGKLQVVFYDFSRSRNQPILNVSTFTLSVQGDGCLEEIPANDAALKGLIEKLGQV